MEWVLVCIGVEDDGLNANKVVSSVAFNYVGVIVVSLAGFVTTPILLHHLGQSDFGAYVLIAAIIGYTSLLDLGIGLTVMRLVAETAHLEDRTQVRRIASTGLVLYGAIGLVVLVVGLAAAPFVGHLFHLEGNRLHDFTIALMITVATVGLTFPAGLYTGINQGFGAFRQQNTIVIGQALAAAALSIVAVLLGGGIVAVAVATVVSTLGGFAAKVIYASRAFGVRPSPRRFERKFAREIMGASSWMFVINIANKAIWDTDNIIAGAVLGPVAVSGYTVALGPATGVRKLTDQFSSVALTAASSLKAQEQRESLRRLLLEATRVVVIVVSPFLVVAGLWGDQFIHLWVGDGFPDSHVTLVVLLLGMLASSVQATSTQILLALNKQRVMAFVSIVEAGANIGLSIYLADAMGIVGIAVGTAIPTAITAFGFYVPFAARELGLPIHRIARRAVLPLAISGTAFLVLCSTRSRLSSPRFSRSRWSRPRSSPPAWQPPSCSTRPSAGLTWPSRSPGASES